MLVFHQDDDAADFSGVDAGGPLMDPILATGVMAIGRKVADSLIARYSNPKPSQASPAFADVLASQKVSASGRSQADPRDLATRIANLEQTLMHSPEVSEFLGSPDAPCELVVSQEGSLAVRRADGAMLPLNGLSELTTAATELHQLYTLRKDALATFHGEGSASWSMQAPLR